MRLAEREAHVWCASPEDINDPDLLRAYHELLAPEEARRHQRFLRAADRRQYLVSRALVRSSLSRYASVDPKGWRFRSTRSGRPEIVRNAEVPPLRFNLSHAPGLAACVVTLERDVGVDVENTERRGHTLEIAERFFSPAETGAIHELPREQQRGRFFDLWTLKEAYIKARGMGLAIPLGQFSFRLERGQPIRVAFGPRLEDDPDAWQFAQFAPTSSHKMAVAVRRESGPDYRFVLRHTVPLLETVRRTTRSPSRAGPAPAGSVLPLEEDRDPG
jgi:4'-phosphopantetheinyl transferase